MLKRNDGAACTDRLIRHLRAWRRAADVYFPAYRDRFTSHGLVTYPAVGDHEIGDDPWRKRRPDPWIDFKRRHVPLFKQVFAEQMLLTTLVVKLAVMAALATMLVR